MLKNGGPMNIDFHSHILPGMENGAKDVETSIKILEKEVQDDIDIVIATPKYNPELQSVEDFLIERDNSYTKLITTICGMEIPSIKLGAEVKYCPKLLTMDNLLDLCIEGTNYLLLELPPVQFNNQLTEEISELTYNRNITPIISHVDDCLRYTSIESLEEILDLDVLGQINASSFIDKEKRKLAFKLIHNNYIHVLGSGANDTVNNPALMKEAEIIIYKKFSRRLYGDFMENAKLVLHNRKIEEILL